MSSTIRFLTVLGTSPDRKAAFLSISNCFWPLTIFIKRSESFKSLRAYWRSLRRDDIILRSSAIKISLSEQSEQNCGNKSKFDENSYHQNPRQASGLGCLFKLVQLYTAVFWGGAVISCSIVTRSQIM